MSETSSRRVSSVRCPRCGADVRVDAEGVLRALAGGDAVPCPACRRSFVPVFGSGSASVRRSASRAAEAGSGSASPPFPSLGATTGEPPPFEARTPAPAVKPRTLADRWNALSPGRQKLLVGAVLAAVAVGVLAWPAAAVKLPPPPVAKEDYPPRPAEPPPVEVVRVVEVPKPVEPPKVEQRTFFVAVSPVAEDTQITEENFGRLFEPHQALTAPPGAVGSKADALGWYVQRPLPTGQLLTHGLLGANRVPRVAVAPTPREFREPDPERQVVRIITASGIRYATYLRHPGGEWALMREQFIPAAAPNATFPEGR